MTRIDDEVASPALNANPTRYDEIFSSFRRESPVRWLEPKGYRPFWAITRYQDIKTIEALPDLFINGPRVTLLSEQEEEKIKQYTGSVKILRMIADMDGEDHKYHRDIAQSWFTLKAVRELNGAIDAHAEYFVDKMEKAGEQCDFVREVASRYPLRVIMSVLGVPESDEPFILRNTLAAFGVRESEAHQGMSSGEAIMNGVTALTSYFRDFAAERRKAPREDVSTALATAQIGQFELESYFFILATAGHDTTSASIAGGLLELIRNPDQLQQLRAHRELMGSAVEEVLRIVTPVKHFMRTAVKDYEVGGQLIRSGDSVMLCFASANRDEDIFEEPARFVIDRKPNAHLAFGFGPHNCLGKHLARMETQAIFEKLLDRFEGFELVGVPTWVTAPQVTGLATLPIRYRSRST
jgi:cytochrome P450